MSKKFTTQFFAGGAQQYIDQLEAAGLKYTTRELPRTCSMCGGGGCAHCEEGIEYLLVVEPIEEQEDKHV